MLLLQLLAIAAAKSDVDGTPVQLKKRGMYRSKTASWSQGIIPYRLHKSLNTNQRLLIRQAMDMLERDSRGGVQFIEQLNLSARQPYVLTSCYHPHGPFLLIRSTTSKMEDVEGVMDEDEDADGRIRRKIRSYLTNLRIRKRISKKIDGATRKPVISSIPVAEPLDKSGAHTRKKTIRYHLICSSFDSTMLMLESCFDRSILSVSRSISTVRASTKENAQHQKSASAYGVSWATLGCSTHLFYNQMAISPYASMGTVLHELMHVLGFEHEHQRGNRDQHVTVKRSVKRWNILNYMDEWQNLLRYTFSNLCCQKLFL